MAYLDLGGRQSCELYFREIGNVRTVWSIIAVKGALVQTLAAKVMMVAGSR